MLTCIQLFLAFNVWFMYVNCLTALIQDTKTQQKCMKNNRPNFSWNDCNLLINPKWHETLNCINTAKTELALISDFRCIPCDFICFHSWGVLTHMNICQLAKQSYYDMTQGHSFHAIVSSSSVAHSAIFVLAFQLKHTPGCCEADIWRIGQEVSLLFATLGCKKLGNNIILTNFLFIVVLVKRHR